MHTVKLKVVIGAKWHVHRILNNEQVPNTCKRHVLKIVSFLIRNFILGCQFTLAFHIYQLLQYLGTTIMLLPTLASYINRQSRYNNRIGNSHIDQSCDQAHCILHRHITPT